MTTNQNCVQLDQLVQGALSPNKETRTAGKLIKSRDEARIDPDRIKIQLMSLRVRLKILGTWLNLPKWKTHFLFACLLRNLDLTKILFV